MGINHSCQLLTPEDIFKLRQGKIRSINLPNNFQCNRDTLLQVAELLIILNDADNLTSQADAVERAISYGYLSSNELLGISSRNSKISLKKILILSFGYCFGLLFLFSILYQLNDRHPG